MQEYSRRATTAESRLEELHKRSVHHDDHLRFIDAWWLQVSHLLQTGLITGLISIDARGIGAFG